MKTLLLVLVFIPILSLAQPRDNALRSRYPSTPLGHFTDSLNWSNVLDITNFNQHPDTDTNVALAMAQLSTQGGGVLYFPTGTYAFSDNLVIPSGVVLRGESSVVNNGKDASFAPQTRFVFPEYLPTFTGNGTPNSTAFKVISCATGASNIGLVDIDINHARIAFSPGSASNNRNILVLSIRQNNAAAPSSQVPDGQGQHGWQRFCDRFANNISISCFANAIVANCRLNDFTNNTVHPVQDASYAQPGYLASSNNGYVTNPDSSVLMFSYTDHYGIRLGRSSGVVYGEPNTAPSLFRTGFEIRDNWLYKTMRVGIYAAGTGLKIIGNVLKDKPSKLVWLRPEGQAVQRNFSATYENRGIDFSGWMVQVDSNEIEVYRHDFVSSQYQTVDGEGVLVQECCGGTSVNDYQINQNSLTGTSAYIGIFKMRDINNLRIKGNNLNNQSNILVLANVNGCGAANTAACYSLNNIEIADNYNLGHNCQFGRGTGIGLDGATGGTNVRIYNNTGRPGGFRECNINIDTLDITAPCWVPLTNDPTRPGANDNILLKRGACSQTLVNKVWPTASLTSPADGSVVPPNAQLQITVNASAGVDQLEYWRDATLLGTQTINDPNFGTWDWTAPAAGVSTYLFTVKAIDRSQQTFVWTTPSRVRVLDPTVLDPNISISLRLSTYPNPVSNQLNIQSASELGHVILIDQLGRIVKSWYFNSQSAQIDLDGTLPGIYVVKSGKSVSRVIKH